jgi:GNAT superfamily N-acetyltransferase
MSTESWLNIRIARAPLSIEESLAVLKDYNRLTFGRIPLEEFQRWVEKSPEGPAWHALLSTEDGRLVGHTSVFPVRATHGEKTFKAAMSEYSYLHEDFRRAKIRGHESGNRPAFIILIDQLFQHCLKQGWGPIFASTNEKNQIFTRKVGLRALSFPLWECLLVLRPVLAARETPNLSNAQRLALFGGGLAQSASWSIARFIHSNGHANLRIPLDSVAEGGGEPRLNFYEDPESRRWRYTDEHYVHYSVGNSNRNYVIAKRGGPDRYLRVCQHVVKTKGSLPTLVRSLVDQASRDSALGVRWALYDGGEVTQAMVTCLRRLGFLCVRRTRIVMVHKDFQEYLDPKNWRMNDSHFCFDP